MVRRDTRGKMEGFPLGEDMILRGFVDDQSIYMNSLLIKRAWAAMGQGDFMYID